MLSRSVRKVHKALKGYDLLTITQMRLLVIGSQRTNYYELFKGCTVGGEAVEVEHCTWDDLHLCSYGDQGG